VPTDVVLPQSGLEVTEATVLSVDVAVGDAVSEGDRLLEVETDKAMREVVAPVTGVVVAIEVAEGDTVEVGATLVRLDAGGDGSPNAEVSGTTQIPTAVGAAAHAPADERRGAHRLRAAPLARRAAAHLGVALADVEGTGPRGRITLRDVESAAEERNARRAEEDRRGGNGAGEAAAATAAAAKVPAGERLEPMTATRRAIARRMTASQQVPQFALQRDLDAAWLLAEKDRISAAGPAKVGVNDLLLQALAETVARHEKLGASFVPGEGDGHPQLSRRHGVDVGLAVATDRGLLVPVIRRVHERTLAEIALDRTRLTSAARAGRLEREDMSGATITLSSLAGLGVDRFNAMLNPGESAILAVGRTADRVVPRDRGLAVVPTMTLTLTLDHRVVDGAAGAIALAELARLLEGGMAWRA
jgi:pyruvate dehydrogenase E2 component (dihydrolipoamide acetyltransferase)